MKTRRGSWFTELAVIRALATVTQRPTKAEERGFRVKEGLQVRTVEGVEMTSSRGLCDGLGHMFGFLP